MRHLALVGLLILTSGAAIAYVYTTPTPKPCEALGAEPQPDDAIPLPRLEFVPVCPKCKPAVVDVVDLNAAYPVGAASVGSEISFDEPPFAKPRTPQIIAAQFEVPVVEPAPAPRDAPELAPEPRPFK